MTNEEKLLEKLSDVAMVRDVTSERRKRFQTKSRDDQRRMTQPVTLDELRRADRSVVKNLKPMPAYFSSLIPVCLFCMRKTFIIYSMF